MSLSTIAVIIVGVAVLILAFRILTGVLRLAIALAIIGFIGYWGYTHLPANIIDSFPK